MKTAATLLLLALAAATPEPRYFHYQRPLQPLTHQGQTCLILDPSIFSHAAPHLADLRLYAGQIGASQTETPYLLHTLVPTESTPEFIKPLNRGTLQDQTVFDADLPTIVYSDLLLNIAAQDFIATVSVSGSDRPDGGLIRIGSYTVFDLTKQRLGRSTVLHLPDSNFPYLHFSINGPLTPDQIIGLSVSSIPSKEPNYQTIATNAHVTQDPRDPHSSKIEFEIAANTPVDRVRFIPGPESRNFSRDVNVTVTPTYPASADLSNGAPQPQKFYGTILRLHTQQGTHKIDEEQFAVSAPSDFNYPTQWTITISNGDNQPVSLNSVRLEMLERSLCFDAQANSRYTLFYGDPALQAPNYDYARFFSADPTPALALLAPEQPTANPQSRPDDRPFTERHPALLWTALIAVIALLGLVALRSIKTVTRPS